MLWYEILLLIIAILLFFVLLIAVILFIMLLPGNRKKVKNFDWLLARPIAHRGYHNGQKDCPENSKAAYQKAIDRNYNIEIDIHVTLDNQIVVFHDDNVERMTGVNKLIKDMTLEEIKQLRLQGGEESIMTLPEFLDLVHDQVGVLIEFKNSQGGKLEKYAWPILEKYNGRWVMQAFQPDSLKWFKQNQPSIPRGQLCFNYMGTKNPWLRKFLYTYLFSNFIGRPNFISYNWPGCKYKTIKLLRKMHAPLLVWTIQNEEVYNQVKDKCDNVIFENLELK